MKKRILNNLLIGSSFIFFLLATACYEDKGNYDYTPVNSVEITGIDSTYIVNIGDKLQITPTLTFEHDDATAEFAYEWHLYERIPQTGYNDSKEILSTDRNLDITIEGTLAKTGTYKFLYRIIDDKTGIVYYKDFELQVKTNPFGIGYIALCEKPQGFDIDMVYFWENTFQQQNNILDHFNSEFPREGNPVGIMAFPDPMAPTLLESDGGNYSVIIYTDKHAGRLGYNDYSYKPSYALYTTMEQAGGVLQYLSPESTPSKVVANVRGESGRAYFYIDNNWFFQNAAIRYYLLSFPINRLKGVSDSDYKTTGHIYMNALNGAVVFNEDEKCFMIQKVNHLSNDIYYTSRIVGSEYLVNDDVDNKLFPYKDPNYELIHLSARSSMTSPFPGYAIVKMKSTGTYKLLQFTFSGYGATIQQISTSDFKLATDIEKATHFAFRGDASYLYYATEDKVYRLYTTEMELTDITSQVVKAPYTKISAMKYTLPWGEDKLAIATYDPSGTVGENGKLELFDMNSTNGNLMVSVRTYEVEQENGEKEERTQTCSWSNMGRIVDFCYKDK